MKYESSRSRGEEQEEEEEVKDEEEGTLIVLKLLSELISFLLAVILSFSLSLSRNSMIFHFNFLFFNLSFHHRKFIKSLEKIKNMLCLLVRKFFENIGISSVPEEMCGKVDFFFSRNKKLDRKHKKEFFLFYFSPI